MAGLLFAAPAGAAPAAYEPFDYPEGALVGRSGGSGWSAPWKARDVSPGVSPLVIGDGLGYIDGAGNTLVTAGGALDTKNGTATSIAFRSLSTRRDGETWISFLTIPTTNGDFTGLTLFDGGEDNNNHSRFGVEQREAGQLNLRLANTEPPPNGPAVISAAFNPPAGSTVFVALRMLPGGAAGGDDLLEVFFNPNLASEPGSPFASLAILPGGFDRLRLAATSGRSVIYDEIRIGDSYADVSPFVPPAEDRDTDGDGLTDLQEIALGLDPTVSDAGLIQAIRENPEFFGLFRAEDLLDEPHAPAVEVPASGPVDWLLRVTASDDLVDWSEVGNLGREIAVPAGKSFIRLNLGQP